MSKTMAVFGFNANPNSDPPMHYYRPKVVKSLIERGFVKQIGKHRAQYIVQAADYSPVKDCHGAHVEASLWRCGALGKCRGVSGALMSAGIATVEPRNIAKIPHEMTPHYRSR